MRYDFVQDDTGSSLRIECLDAANAPIDITGGTVTLKWRDKARQLITHDMSMIDAVNGIAEYQFAVGELFAPSMDITVRIVDSQGQVLHSRESIKLSVRYPI